MVHTNRPLKKELHGVVCVSSGFLLGLSEGLGLLLLFSGVYLGFLAAVGMAGLYALCVYLVAAKTKCLQSYLEELHQIG